MRLRGSACGFRASPNQLAGHRTIWRARVWDTVNARLEPATAPRASIKGSACNRSRVGWACGLGKSWLACALGQKACREDLSVLYYRVPRLLAALALGRGDGRYSKLLRSLARVKLFILDDWGPEALTAEQARDLLEIVEDRYDAGTILLTSQVPVDRWHDMIGVPTLADAILDRLVHNAYRIELSGESLRKRQSS
jgi:DNA replication protein DnaC